MRQTSSKALPNSDALCVFAWLPSLLTLPVSATTPPPHCLLFTLKSAFALGFGEGYMDSFLS